MTLDAEAPMQLHPPTSAALDPALPVAGGCIFLIRSDIARPEALAGPAREALGAADAVLYDGNADPGILALVRSGAFVEPIASQGERAPAKSAAIARAGKLASEGWRVVWLGSGDAERSPAAFAAAAGNAIHVCTDVCAHEPTARSALGRGPQPLATAFNGLAG